VKLIAFEYHDVVAANDWDSSGFPGPAARPYKIARAEFDKHLSLIAERAPAAGQRVLDAMALSPSRNVPVLFTFDDGGSSALTDIAPCLEKHGWAGHFFIATDFIGTRGFLDAYQLRELLRRGHVVGSHSCSHPLRMSLLGEEALAREWSKSVEELSTILGTPVTVGSVPGGAMSREVAAAAARAGITALFTSEPIVRTSKVDGCTLVGRFTIRDRTPSDIVMKVVDGDAMPWLRQWTRWNALKIAKGLAGPAYYRMRKWLFERRAREV
jgi:peptidoglycan/xylan/chitin deacetylase (PgdA/CDA1 family)